VDSDILRDADEINALLRSMQERVDQINARINALAQINAFYREEVELLWYIIARIGINAGKD
jgi:hypothetical protein